MTEPPLGIHEDEPTAIQARHSLMIAHEEGVLSYYWPVDLDDPDDVRTLLVEIGDVELPKAGKTYYLVKVQVGREMRPLLVPENDACAFVFGLTLGSRPDAIERVVYHQGMLLG